MIEKNKSLSVFLLHFLERLNGCESIEKKITESLTDICTFYKFKKGFVYQTDGFRYFFLKETIGNEDHSLKPRFEMSEMTKIHSDRMKVKNRPFYASRNDDNSLVDIDVLDFHKTDSLLVRQFEDSEGKIIGFIGFADREDTTPFTDEELQTIHLLLGSLSKEIAVREYKEREVRASNTLGSIMNNMGVDIYVNSFDSHDMLYANASMAAPYGGIKHFEGKKCWQALYTDKTGECEFCPKRHLIDENGLPTKVYSWDYQRPFDQCWFRVFSAAFPWIDGQMAHVITSVDIDHQKKIEEELIIAKDKAENLDRLKSAFLANMSHEIRTPLNAIIGFSSLIAELDLTAEEKEQYANIITTNNELLLKLVNDILDLARIESGGIVFHKESCNLTDLVKTLYKQHLSDVPEGIEFKEKCPDTPICLYSDKERLYQALENILKNAIKFTSAGFIEIGYEYSADAQDVRVYVQDTGIGISPEDQEAIFERFKKLDDFVSRRTLAIKGLNNQYQMRACYDKAAQFYKKPVRKTGKTKK